jgi:hypothetical protein
LEAPGLGVEEVLAPALRDRSSRFVFPSEICAESWLARALRIEGAPAALEADRFMGWDSFKETAAPRSGARPADGALRGVFAATLLAENARSPFLSALLPPEHAADWRPFSGYVASRLAALGPLPDALRDSGFRRGAGPGELPPRAADWMAVRGRYESFLRALGRFEPSYEPRALAALPGRTRIFFPELIEDFATYAPILEAMPGVELLRLPSARPGAALRRPSTALAEIREVLSEIGALLDSGRLGPADIAITAAGLDRYRPYLEREAELLSVPISVKSGLSLAAAPGGRLLAAIRDASSSGFSLDSLRDLLLSPAWPWKEPRAMRGIVEAGSRFHALAPWPEGGRMVDALERSLPSGLASAYRRLRRGVSAIASAPSLAALLKSYNAFKSEFLSPDPGAWSEEADLTLARCVIELQKLKAAEAEAGIEVEDALGLLMRTLEATTYVPSRSGAGVPVYEWRVAAGSGLERHFVLGASQDSLAVPDRSFDFLGDSLRARLAGRAPAASRDAAPDFIKAYALSGGVVFSCPAAGLGGEEAVQGFLATMAGGAEAPAFPLDPAYREESAWLSGRAPAPRRWHRAQAAGFEAAALALPASPGGGAALSGATAAGAAARLSKAPGEAMGLDSTAIDRYRSCPYAYLYLKLLDAGPEASGAAFADAFFLGDAYHATLAILFERIRELDGRFRPERLDAYRGLLDPCLTAAFDSLGAARGPFVAVVLEAYRGMLEAYLVRLLEAEAERFPNLEVGPIEESFELAYPELEGGVLLRGRVDRISLSAKGAVIVDYKKSRLPTKAQVAPDEGGEIALAQLPCYLRLVSGSKGGSDIDSAWYLTIEGNDRLEPGSGACAFGDPSGGREPFVGREALGTFLRAFDRALAETARGIRAGAYPLAPKETQKEACRDCGARGICRERYALRFGLGGPSAATIGRTR